jgi:hypothetical protein
MARQRWQQPELALARQMRAEGAGSLRIQAALEAAGHPRRSRDAVVSLVRRIDDETGPRPGAITAAEQEAARRMWCDGVSPEAIVAALVAAGFPRRADKTIYRWRQDLGWPKRGQGGSPQSVAKRSRKTIPAGLPPAAADPVAREDGISFMALKPDACRWPLWGNRERVALETMRFCGEPVTRPGTPYCAACAAKAFEGKPEPHIRPEPGFRLPRLTGAR